MDKYGYLGVGTVHHSHKMEWGGDQEDEAGKNFLTGQVNICGQIWVFGGGDSTPFSQDGVGGARRLKQARTCCHG